MTDATRSVSGWYSFVCFQAKLCRARQAQLCDGDGNPLFRPTTGRPPTRERNSAPSVPRWETLYSQRNQAEEKRQDLARQLAEEEQRARSAASRMNPKSEALLAGVASST